MIDRRCRFTGFRALIGALVCMGVVLSPERAVAQLQVDITSGVTAPIPIAIEDFTDDPQATATVIRQNLGRSGRFLVGARTAADYLLIGRAAMAADGRITGAREGRTFVVAEASRNTAVADSLLVFVPKTGTGPIIRTTLPSYRITTDTFSIVVQIESRDGQPLSAADLEIAWPGVAAFPYSPFTVTAFSKLRTGVEASQVDAQETLRVTWTSATPVNGPVQLIRLSCRVYTRRAGNQLVIRLNQLLQGDLTDVTASTSVFNPIVIIP